MNSLSFVVACPKGIVTGGPEALHQLDHSLRKHGVNSKLWDPNVNRSRVSPAEKYREYNCTWMDTDPAISDVIVIPEIMSQLVARFYNSNPCIIWWLSVDNFISSNGIPLEILRDYFPKLIHAYQSEYANRFLSDMQVTGALSLSDYINSEYLMQSDEASLPDNIKAEEHLIAINPAKGFGRTTLVLEKLPKDKVIRLEKMSNSEVAKALRNARYYLDLGNHPGKDRFPREVASQGCIVVTNKRGSAANDVDIPIDFDGFKFDDSKPDFADLIVSKLSKMDLDPSYYRQKQESYLESIRSEKSVFEAEVIALIAFVDSHLVESTKESSTQTSQLPLYFAEMFRQRDSANQERDSANQERDSANQERDRGNQERDSANQERDSANQERDSANQERDSANQERDSANQERDSANQERDSANQERDSANQERDSANQERDSANQERDSANQERDSANQERDSANQERDSAKHRILELEMSLSWKITKPLRAIHNFLKNAFK